MGRSRGTKKSRARSGGGLGARFRDMLSGFLFGRTADEETSDRLQEIKGLALLGFSLWLVVSMASFYKPFSAPQAAGRNWGGQVGFYLADNVHLVFGLAGYLLACLGLAWGVILCARKHLVHSTLRVFGGLCLLFAVSFLLQLGLGSDELPGQAAADTTPVVPYGPGGWLAKISMPSLVEKFGGPGLWILLGLCAVLSFILATERAFYPAFCALSRWLDERRESRGESMTQALWGWTKRLFLGLWDFLRGADLAAASPGVGTIEAPRAAATRTGKSAKKSRKTKASDLFDPDDVEDEEEPAAELEEDEEEYEYEDDEEGEEEDDEEYEYEDDDPDAEYEYEYEDEDEEYEYEDDEEGDEEEEEPEEEDLADEELVPAAASKEKPRAAVTQARALQEPLHLEPPTPPPGPWRFPSLDLLEDPEAAGGVDGDFLEKSATKLENALKSFRIAAQVVAAQVGPAVTMFELTVAEGTRMNRVTALSQEIAAALRARSVRIIAPIPGRDTIGIEIPNTKRRVVRMKELIGKDAYNSKAYALPLFLGMDAEGGAIVADLAKMPHLLIAGTTGSGKSVCINTILASLLLTRSPHDVKMVLVDPKMVELQMYHKVPHLLLPVVTDMKQATNVLLWTVEKMEGRYELFRDAGVKNIKSYNALGEEKLREALGDAFNEERTPRHLPYIVLVIDEMADLMMTSKKEAEGSITRLAQKSRAVGIHVIVATQRPSTDVITGVLKGNLPTRIAFQVASKIDSRVILDTSGAEKLLGGGDMLYTPPQTSQLKRVQGALVEDHELQSLVDFVCEESAPTFSQELVQSATGTKPAGQGKGAQEDDLWDEAVRVILKSRRGSASLLQRALGVGYTRASRLIDLMTEEGIVGEHKGSKAREVLLTLEEWETMQGTPAGQGVSDE